MTHTPDHALIGIRNQRLKVLARFVLDVNMLPNLLPIEPIACPTCRARCFDLNPDTHNPHCDVASMLRKATRKKMPEVRA